MPPSPVGAGSDSLCAPFLAGLPVDHVAIATMGDPFEVRTVCATDDLAARFNRMELDYGEGPSWQTRTTRSPVLTPDIRAGGTAEWPVLAGVMADSPLQSVYAFPLAIGVLSLGAVGLYADAPDVLDTAAVSHAVTLAAATALGMLREAVRDLEDPGALGTRVVHQATGMVLAQLRISPDEAQLVLRGHAFAAGRSLEAVARDVVERRLDFTP